MKILIISDAWHPQINGVVRTYENLIPILRKRGHHVEIIGPASFSLTLPCPTYPDIRLVLGAHRPLKRLIADFSPDHLHIATEGPLGWSARRIALAAHIPFTTCYHSQFPEFISARIPRWANRLKPLVERGLYANLRRFHRPALKTFVVSEALKTFLCSHGFDGNFTVMSRGIDTHIFYCGDGHKFKSLKRPIALYVGRVSVEKTIESFLNAPWDGSKVVVGSGPDEARLKSRYPEVTFLGTQTGQNLGDCYRSADLFVFPSKSDTFGLVNIEALACGLPIAAYPEMGPRAIVTLPELGYLHENLEIAMTNAIFCPGDAEFRQNYVKTVYSWEEAATQFLSALPNYG